MHQELARGCEIIKAMRLIINNRHGMSAINTAEERQTLAQQCA